MDLPGFGCLRGYRVGINGLTLAQCLRVLLYLQKYYTLLNAVVDCRSGTGVRVDNDCQVGNTPPRLVARTTRTQHQDRHGTDAPGTHTNKQRRKQHVH